MKTPARQFLIVSSVACLMLAGGAAANAGSRGMSHNAHSSGTNDTGAANHPNSAAQPKPTVTRDHGDKPATTTTTTTTTGPCGHGHHNCATVRDHTSGPQGDWHPPHGSTGPAGGPNSRKPPS